MLTTGDTGLPLIVVTPGLRRKSPRFAIRIAFCKCARQRPITRNQPLNKLLINLVYWVNFQLACTMLFGSQSTNPENPMRREQDCSEHTGPAIARRDITACIVANSRQLVSNSPMPSLFQIPPRITSAIAGAMLLISMLWSTAGITDVLTFGVVPQQSASKLARLWSPIVEHLGRNTGHTIRFSTAPDIPEFERRLARGEYDLAYMNPYHFVVFNAKPGYRALVHARDKRIRGIIVTRRDNPIEKLEELDNQRIAFPAPAAFAASILTRSKLASVPVDFEPVYVSSHDSVYRAVAQGLFAAGGGVMRTFNNVEPAIKRQLRILWTTDGYTPHAVAANPDMDSGTRLQVQRALIEMEKDEAGRAMLKSIGLKGFEAAKDAAWDDVRNLQLNLLNDL
jgi:phosphonate transport system substrate-binding protein